MTDKTMLEALGEVDAEDRLVINQDRISRDSLQFIRTYSHEIRHNALRLKAMEQVIGEMNEWFVNRFNSRADEIMRGEW